MPSLNQHLRWSGLPASAADTLADPALSEPDLDVERTESAIFGKPPPTLETIRQWMEEEEDL